MSSPLSSARDVAGAMATSIASTVHGREWIIDAHGCEPAALRDVARLRALIDRLIAEWSLTPVAPGVWHTFPAPGGITGFVVLAESHVACHSFPEFGSICVNVFCCRPRPDINVISLMAEMLGATDTRVRIVERIYVPDAAGGA
jgi:S-adenosylmethionine decarboxylase